MSDCSRINESPASLEATYDTEQSFSDPSEAVCSEETALVSIDEFTKIPLACFLPTPEPKPAKRYDLYVSTMDPRDQLTAIRAGLIEEDAAKIMVRQGREVVAYLEATTPPDQTAARNEIAALRVQLDEIELQHPELQEPLVASSENRLPLPNDRVESQPISNETMLAESTSPAPVLKGTPLPQETILSVASVKATPIGETDRQAIEALRSFAEVETGKTSPAVIASILAGEEPAAARRTGVVTNPSTPSTPGVSPDQRGEPIVPANTLSAVSGNSNPFEEGGNFVTAIRDSDLRKIFERWLDESRVEARRKEGTPERLPLVALSGLSGKDRARDGIPGTVTNEVPPAAILQGSIASSRPYLTQANAPSLPSSGKGEARIRPPARSPGNRDGHRQDGGQNRNGQRDESRQEEQDSPAFA
ncbi:MAG: hypothetical protein HYS22_04345 [Deltaproteobacteria bacterium]|nr:hypothetical protein [Deltaproteobacteria bacterium]